VQDAAPGIGSMYGSKGVATLGDFSCFSFQGAKLLVSGEGGVLTTNDEELFERAFKIGDSGRKPGTFWIESLGKKMKMSNLTASLALAQLQSAERQITRKRQIRTWYAEVLDGIEGVQLQQEAESTRSICWMTSVFVDREGFDRDALRLELLGSGIDTRPVFSPISRYPYWDQPRAENTVASRIGDNSINLPSGVRLSEPTIKRVAHTLKALLET
jgi:perosamine synthetase